jgi:MerR family transcriptional regulator, light-induced transcriptional regulator
MGREAMSRTEEPPERAGDASPETGVAEPTYSLGAVSRLTGLSEHVLRAWERRYGAVRPLRTPGGTRRYRESDVARLRLLRGAVDAGHAIRELAGLADAELARRARLASADAVQPPLAPILAAVEALDAERVERLVGAQLSALGPARFVRQVASPLLVEVGDRWHAGRLPVACEHLVSTTLRNLLGGCLRRTSASDQAPPVVFTTPPGERHDLGTLMAAVVAVDAGGHPVFLGGDLPIEEVAHAARSVGAAAVAVGVCLRDGEEIATSVAALRAALPPSVEIWVGGPAADSLPLPAGAARIEDLDDLERKVALLAVRGTGG